MLLGQVFLLLVSLVLCVGASAQDGHCLERATEGARGAVVGLGEGVRTRMHDLQGNENLTTKHSFIK
jgi:hypothetical protein